MAIVTTDDSHYKAIADATRENYPEVQDATFTPDEMPDEISAACNYNHDVGFEEGKAEGITEGIQTEYDRFWDAYQQNGNRTEYNGAFAGTGWTTETFKPKYDIVVTSAYQMFGRYGCDGVDLVSILNERGLKFDTSGCTSFTYFSMYGGPATFPTIDTRQAANLANMFLSNHQMVSVVKIILRDDGSQTFGSSTSSTFYNNPKLENIEIEGVIGNTISFQWSTKLSKASITSVVNALSSTTSGLSVTFSKTAVNTAFATTEGGTDGSTSAEWTALANTKKNWTINLV